MNIDISRDSFDPSKNYSGVLMQQGRALVDAEWNEQVAVINHQMRRSLAVLTKDLGPCCEVMERTDDGFKVRMKKGPFFVDGVRCDLKKNVEVSYPINGKDFHNWTLSVHAWEAIVADPCLQDPALNGADSGLRTRIKWNLQIDRGRPDRDFQAWINNQRGAITVEAMNGTRNKQPALYQIEITKDTMAIDTNSFVISKDGQEIQPSKQPLDWKNDAWIIEIENRLRLTFSKANRAFRKNDRWLIPYRVTNADEKMRYGQDLPPSGQHYFEQVKFQAALPDNIDAIGQESQSIEIVGLAAQVLALSVHYPPLISASGLIRATTCLPLKKWLSTALLSEVVNHNFDTFLLRLLKQLPRSASTDLEFASEAEDIWKQAHQVMEVLKNKAQLGSITQSA